MIMMSMHMSRLPQPNSCSHFACMSVGTSVLTCLQLLPVRPTDWELRVTGRSQRLRSASHFFALGPPSAALTRRRLLPDDRSELHELSRTITFRNDIDVSCSRSKRGRWAEGSGS